MQKQGHEKAGFSLIEMLVVISIVATLLALILPVMGGVRRRIYVHQCLQNLHQIGVALRIYEQDYGRESAMSRGDLAPPHLGDLAPSYVSPSQLVCPWVTAVAPQGVQEAHRAMQEKYKGRFGRYWNSYFVFYRKGLDALYRRGESPISYSQIIRMRGDNTPFIVCRNHREPAFQQPGFDFSSLSAPWDFPEQPIVVLRLGGQVDLTLKGGTVKHGTHADTLYDALEF
jgi:prepilin-type N-terminal cleavage/methylation domain-containing protein